jgi:hypothetical protein
MIKFIFVLFCLYFVFWFIADLVNEQDCYNAGYGETSTTYTYQGYCISPEGKVFKLPIK